MTDSSIFGITGREEFESRCIETFRYQYEYCPQYRSYSGMLGITPDNVRYDSIPFLPIRFFKQFDIVSKGYRRVSGDPVLFTTGKVSQRE